ncbi:MAG: aldo/keto reductase [Acidobacteriota bacterium]
MRRIRFGRTEAEVSTVSLGTWAHGGPKIVGGRPVGWYGSDPEAAKKSLVESARVGINHWDTADVYGDGRAERLVGEVWDEVSRDDVFLATKVGWDPGPYGHYYHPEQIRRQLERSLRYLRVETIDLYYLHHCDFGPSAEYLDDAVALLRKFRDEGKIRFIGLSDWKSELILRFAPRVDPDVVQCYRNVVDDTYESSGLRNWVRDHDIGVSFFSPIKHGLLLGLFEGPVTFGIGDHRNAIQDFRDYSLLSRLRACRREVEARFDGEMREPVLQALIGALLVEEPSGCALLGLHRTDQVSSAAEVGSPLSAEDARWVRRLYAENGRPTRSSWRMRTGKDF